MAKKRQLSTVPHPQAKRICGKIEDVNTAATSTLQHQLTTILTHFEGIEDEATLAVKDGASMAPFSASTMYQLVQEGRAYRCCCSIFILNLYQNPNPEVPIVARQVRELMLMFFKTAPDLDDLPEITVNAPDKKPETNKIWGTLPQVSPYEMTIAFIGACYRDLINSNDTELHKRWKHALLAVPMVFKNFPDNEAAFMHGVSLRQKAIQAGISLQRTPSQWAIEILSFREMVTAAGGKPLSAMALAQKFIDANFEFATTAETPTKTFIENVLVINQRMLSVPEIKDALAEADEQLGSEETPFNKVNTLHIICQKANTPDKILFAVTLMTKLVQSGVMVLEDLGARKLKGMQGCLPFFGILILTFYENQKQCL